MPSKKNTTSENSPVKSGGDPRGQMGGESSWLKIDSNSTIDVVPLVEVDDILHCEQCAIWLEDGGKSPVWVYIGSDDPSNDLKAQRRYRAFLPVWVLPEKEVQVWAMGKGAHGQILDIADAIGELKGANLRIKRTGMGLQTRYNITPRGTRTDVKRAPEVDVISMLGPMDREGIEKLICERLNAPDYDTVLEKFRGKEITKALPKVKNGTTKFRGNHAPMPEEDEDTETEDEEDLDDVELS